jgi:hypothetical protein
LPVDFRSVCLKRRHGDSEASAIFHPNDANGVPDLVDIEQLDPLL